MEMQRVAAQPGCVRRSNSIRIAFLSFFVFIFLFSACDEKERQQSYTSPQALQLLDQAQKAIATQDYLKALSFVDSAAIYDRSSPDIYFIRGLVFEHLDRLDEARNNYSTVYKLQPDYAGIRFYLGNVQFKFEEYPDAARLFREAIDNYESKRDGFALSRAHLNLGLTYAKMGKPDSALYIYNQAIAHDSSNAEAYFRIARHHKDAGDLDQSLQNMLNASRLDKDNPEYHFELGELYFQKGDMAQAVPHLQETVARVPWHYRAYYQLGQALLRTGEEKTGQQYLARADTLKEKFANIVRLEQKARLEPTNAIHWSNLGRAYAEIGDYETARRALATAASRDPASLALRNDVAYMSVLLGRHDEAISHFNSILKQDSTFAKAWLNLGLAYARTGRIEQARHAWEKALAVQPGNAQARHFLARLP